MGQPDSDDLRQLDQLVLVSVFAGQPLPGGDAPLTLPDLGFVLRQDAILVAEDGLAGPLSADPLPRPLRVLSSEQLTAESRDAEIAFLQFHNDVLDDSSVRVTLEVRLLSGDAGPAGLGLSAVHVVFRRQNGAWHADGPVMSAA